MSKKRLARRKPAANPANVRDCDISHADEWLRRAWYGPPCYLAWPDEAQRIIAEVVATAGKPAILALPLRWRWAMERQAWGEAAAMMQARTLRPFAARLSALTDKPAMPVQVTPVRPLPRPQVPLNRIAEAMRA